MSEVKRYQLPITDQSFTQDFEQWWEEHGQYVRSGGTGHEVPFAFQAWRYLVPVIAELQASSDRLAAENERLRAEAEALRVALLEIASANPAERGIEWAKSYASDGLNGSGSELYARWLDTFNEAEALRAENGRLRAGMNGDYDLDAWLSWAVEAEKLRAESEALKQQEPKPAIQRTMKHWGIVRQSEKSVSIVDGATYVSFSEDEADKRMPWLVEFLSDLLAGADPAAVSPSVSGLVEALDGLVSAANSVNCGAQHVVKGLADDQPCYWQRKEWVDWLKELGAIGAKALAAHRANGGE